MKYIIGVAIAMFFGVFMQTMLVDGLEAIYLTLLAIIVTLQIIMLIKMDKNKK